MTSLPTLTDAAGSRLRIALGSVLRARSRRALREAFCEALVREGLVSAEVAPPDAFPTTQTAREGATASIPIEASGRRLGVLLLRSADPAAFAPPAMEALTDLAGALGEALHGVDRAEEELEGLRRLSQTDPLTGLGNREAFAAALNAAVEADMRYGRPFAVLFVDLDGFKAVNDRQGHAEGDRVLVEMAGRLAGALRISDTVARWGGDEFVALVAGISGPDAAEATGNHLLAALALPAGSAGVRLTASIGAALCPFHGRDPDRLMEAADAAMYEAKACGKAAFRIHGAAAAEAAE